MIRDLCQRILALNPAAGEIGEGMLRDLQERAQRVMDDSACLAGEAPLSGQNTNLLRDILHPTGRCSGQMTLDDLGRLLDAAREQGRRGVQRVFPSCGHSEPESDWRCPDTGQHRTARCEAGWLVVRGNGQDSITNGTMFISSRKCPKCQPSE